MHVLRQASMAMARVDLANATDAELVACFAAGRDQRAFAEIVQRHGPMVLGVARRVLRNDHDAEDAFQATFLALASAATRVRWQPVVAAWLYQTALRCARTIGRTNARWKRRRDEAREFVQQSYEMNGDDDLRAAIDEELRRLPEKLRAAVVLCDLESLSRNEAAARLGVPTSTVRTQLARGREILRSRLLKRGVAGSAAGIVAAIVRPGGVSAAITSSLLQQTTEKALLFAAGKSAAEVILSQTVLQTATGVVRAMTITKLSTLATAAVVICLSAGFVHETIGMLGSTAVARTIFLEDFDDFTLDDGEPVVWSRNRTGVFDASTGDLILTPNSSSLVSLGVDARDFDLADTSVRTQGRVSAAGGFLAITARNQAPNDEQQYAGGVSYSPQQGGTVLFLARSDMFTGSLDSGIEFLGGFPVLPFDIRNEDAVIQLDVIGNQLSLWGWKAGESKPDAPQLTATDEKYASGFVRIGGGIGDNGDSVTTIRFVHVADASIPEPSSVVIGTFAIGVLLLGYWRRWR